MIPNKCLTHVYACWVVSDHIIDMTGNEKKTFIVCFLSERPNDHVRELAYAYSE